MSHFDNIVQFSQRVDEESVARLASLAEDVSAYKERMEDGAIVDDLWDAEDRLYYAQRRYAMHFGGRE